MSFCDFYNRECRLAEDFLNSSTVMSTDLDQIADVDLQLWVYGLPNGCLWMEFKSLDRLIVTAIADNREFPEIQVEDEDYVDLPVPKILPGYTAQVAQRIRQHDPSILLFTLDAERDFFERGAISMIVAAVKYYFKIQKAKRAAIGDLVNSTTKNEVRTNG